MRLLGVGKCSSEAQIQGFPAMRESTAGAGDILNKQKPAGPPDSWYEKRESAEAQRLEVTIERSQIAECSGIASAERSWLSWELEG